MRLKPEQVASILAVCKGKDIDMKDVFIWLPTAFVKSVCYETTPFVAETILDWECNMPLLIRFGLDNYAHAQTVDTRPFFLGRVGPGNEVEARLAVTCLKLHD